jgi:hypothetical protein
MAFALNSIDWLAGIHPSARSFTRSAPPSAPPPGEGGSEGGGLDVPGGEGGQIPPELMEQIRRQLEAQGMGGAEPE